MNLNSSKFTTTILTISKPTTTTTSCCNSMSQPFPNFHPHNNHKPPPPISPVFLNPFPDKMKCTPLVPRLGKTSQAPTPPTGCLTLRTLSLPWSTIYSAPPGPATTSKHGELKSVLTNLPVEDNLHGWMSREDQRQTNCVL